MLVTHAFWSPGRGPCVWAEDSRPAVTSHSQAIGGTRAHPFAATYDQLSSALGDDAAGIEQAATLMLPSTRRSPLDSPELVRATPRQTSSHSPMLLRWSVPALGLPPEAAGSLAVTTAGQGRPGASMRYLADVADFADDLARRGRVLPAVVQEHQGWAARWAPVVQGPDIVTRHALLTAMPPVFRAAATGPSDRSGHDPGELLDDMLALLTDDAVRCRLGGTSLLPKRRGRKPTRLPAAEAWVEALTRGGELGVDDQQAAELAAALAPWDALGKGQTGPARVTFRLIDPPGPADGDDLDGVVPAAEEGARHGWRLDFLLQSMDDPSLLVPAEQVWSGGDGLHRWLDRPDELLLAELGRASTLYPPLVAALRASRPCALDLDPQGVIEFLAQHSALLDQAGFGVLVPSWWTRRQALGLRGSAGVQQDGVVTGGRFSREALVDFQWRLAIGDDPLTQEELDALAAAKEPLLWMRGQWVAVDRDQVRRGLEFLSRTEHNPSTAAEVIALAAGHPDDLDTPLPVTGVDASGMLGDLLSGAAELTLEPVEPPADFGAELRPYQSRGLSWLSFLADLGLGACLADDMGLGKTVQLLALESYRRQANPDAAPTLLLCPMSLVGNWQREAARFAPGLRTYAHHGRERLHGQALTERLGQTDVVMTTYHTATRDIDELREPHWGAIVLDEAQAIKNSLSHSAKAVRDLRGEQRIALTGTPMENRLAELWSIMDFLNPGILGTPDLFRSRYAVPIEREGQTEPAQRLRQITRPYLLRRVKTDPQIIDDLPEKIEIKQYCQLTTEQASLYQTVVNEMLDKIESSTGIKRRGNVLAAMTKLKQICNHPAQYLHDRSAIGRRSGKIGRLDEIVEEILAEGDKALLFTQYTEFAELLLPYLSTRFDTEVAYLHGKTPKDRRDQMVTRFQAEGDPSLFLLSLKAGGTGLNLTAANHVVHLDRWWNPAVENQATDRAFRIGQKRNVQVRKFICVGTLEEKIDEMIDDKKSLADAVISDGERWLTELSTGALRDLFTLSEGAVDE